MEVVQNEKAFENPFDDEPKVPKAKLKDQAMFLVKKRIASMFLRNIVFVGRYWDNLQEMKRFKMNNNILVQGVVHLDNMQVPVGIDTKADPAMNDAIKQVQMKLIKKHLRKEKRMVLFYVEDNFITRGLGWGTTPDDFALSK